MQSTSWFAGIAVVKAGFVPLEPDVQIIELVINPSGLASWAFPVLVGASTPEEASAQIISALQSMKEVDLLTVAIKPVESYRADLAAKTIEAQLHHATTILAIDDSQDALDQALGWAVDWVSDDDAHQPIWFLEFDAAPVSKEFKRRYKRANICAWTRGASADDVEAVTRELLEMDGWRVGKPSSAKIIPRETQSAKGMEYFERAVLTGFAYVAIAITT